MSVPRGAGGGGTVARSSPKTTRSSNTRSTKAIANAKMTLDLPEFTRNDLEDSGREFARFLGLTGQAHALCKRRMDLIIKGSGGRAEGHDND